MYQQKLKYFLYVVLCIFAKNSAAQRNGPEVYVETIHEVKVFKYPAWEAPTYWPYPDNGRKFVECSNGEAIVHDCPPFTVWDKDLLACHYERVAPCLILSGMTEMPGPKSTIPYMATTPTTSATTKTTQTTTTLTTDTPTTTTQLTTRPTTSTPTTATLTITTPTKTTTTTPTPTTSTTTPTTTMPTTTRPSTTTPTTTRPITTPTTTTTQAPSPIGDGVYTIVHSPRGMAFSVYRSNLTDSNKIHAMPHVPSCSDLSQVWKLEYNATSRFYILRSALGTGSNQWTHGLHASSKLPYIWKYLSYGDSFWKLDAVPGTQFYTIYQTETGRTGNIRYTGVANDIGVDLDIAPASSTVPEQQWEFVRCPAY